MEYVEARVTHVSYTEVRRNLARHLGDAIDHREPVVVTGQGGKGSVVMISEAEFAGWQDTVHLLSSPRYAERLLRRVRQAEGGATIEHELVPASPPLGE